MPSPLKSAWTIEYMPAAPTLLPATEKIAGELNTGRGGGDDGDCDAGAEVAFEIVAGAGRRRASRSLPPLTSAKLALPNPAAKTPMTNIRYHARSSALPRQNAVD